MSVSVVVGNPRPGSRTFAIANAVAEEICALTGDRRGWTVDLANVAGRLFDWPDSELSLVTGEIAKSRIIVFASPTYKAAYTGMLKAFLDRYPRRGLRSTIAVPVMTGSTLEHSMSVDTALRPILVELGATLPTTGLYFLMSQMPQMRAVVRQWRDENAGILTRLCDCSAPRDRWQMDPRGQPPRSEAS